MFTYKNVCKTLSSGLHCTFRYYVAIIWVQLLDLQDVVELSRLHNSDVFLLLCFLPYMQLDTDDLTVENSISKSFDKILRFQLNPVWHQLVRCPFNNHANQFYLFIIFVQRSICLAVVNIPIKLFLLPVILSIKCCIYLKYLFISRDIRQNNWLLILKH